MQKPHTFKSIDKLLEDFIKDIEKYKGGKYED